MLRALPGRRIRNPVPDLRKLFCIQLSEAFQFLHTRYVPQGRKRLRTFPPAVVVGRRDQGMFHVAVRDDQPVLSEHKRHKIILQRVRIQIDRMILLSHGRGKLIHDPAVHAAVLILRLLSDQGQVDPAQFLQPVLLPDHQSRQNLHGGGGRKAAPGRQVTRKHQIRTVFQGDPPLQDRIKDSFRVLGPFLRPSRHQLPQRNLRDTFCRHIQGVHTQHGVLPGGDHAVNAHRQCARKNMSSVIICVFSDQIHPPGRKKHASVRTPVLFPEAILQLFHNICVHVLSPLYLCV